MSETIANKHFVSTAIPYVNASPHIGFSLELIQADVIARYWKQRGYPTFFVTGTDENSLKNARAAERAGRDVKEFVDEHAEQFKKLTKALNLRNDDFIRTTEKRHIAGARRLWNACLKAGDIYKKRYKGLYCVGCESFKTKKELIDGKCPEHGTKPDSIEEENYFFKLSKYEKQLMKLFESGDIIIKPKHRANEITEFIREGLEDFSISRSRARAHNWGIPVPGDEEQIMYVWFDALTNYINAMGYGDEKSNFEKFWGQSYRTHLIGKGITRFHAVYWPAMLMSAGIALPNEILVHGYVTVEGKKISKSLGNSPDPFALIEKHGADAIRYFLLREIPSGEDGDFSLEKLHARYNGDLANGLGNLVRRIATLIDSKLDGELIYEQKFVQLENIQEKDVIDAKEFYKFVENFELHHALDHVWTRIGIANRYIDDKKPWVQIKDNPEEFLKTMTTLVAILHHVTRLLVPFIPETTDRIATTFSDDLSNDVVPEGYKFLIKKGEPLFPRIEI